MFGTSPLRVNFRPGTRRSPLFSTQAIHGTYHPQTAHILRDLIISSRGGPYDSPGTCPKPANASRSNARLKTSSHRPIRRAEMSRMLQDHDRAQAAAPHRLQPGAHPRERPVADDQQWPHRSGHATFRPRVFLVIRDLALEGIADGHRGRARRRRPPRADGNSQSSRCKPRERTRARPGRE